MATGARVMRHEDVAIQPDPKRKFLFTSGGNELHADGIRERIAVRPGPENFGRPVQATVGAALERARNAGQENPIVVGAIPFDLGEVSCLYVPERHEWRTCKEPNGAAVTKRIMPELLAQRSYPDEAGFKRAVQHAIVNFQHSDVRKAVLSVIRELQFAEPVDVERLMTSLRAQNTDGYQFQVPLPDGSELIGVSPELLIRKNGRSFTSNPLAGSTRRLPELAADRDAGTELLRSERIATSTGWSSRTFTDCCNPIAHRSMCRISRRFLAQRLCGICPPGSRDS